VIFKAAGAYLQNDHGQLGLTVTVKVDSREGCDLSR
jgi:hypothetical protein